MGTSTALVEEATLPQRGAEEAAELQATLPQRGAEEDAELQATLSQRGAAAKPAEMVAAAAPATKAFAAAARRRSARCSAPHIAWPSASPSADIRVAQRL